MPKHHPRIVAAQARAFLERLETLGNVRLAAAEAQVSYRTMQRRRAADPAFAQRWDAALVMAQARLGGGSGRNRPSTIAPSGATVPLPERSSGRIKTGPRTAGGEAVVVRRRDGTLQVRRAHPGRLTRAAEQAFLLALSATCNVRLAAAAAGTQATHFYRRRLHDPGFAREWRLALEQGYERVQFALLEASLVAAHEHDEWRTNDPPALPPMTVNQALQLLHLHRKEALMLDEPPHLKRRRGESRDAHGYRLARMHEATMEREREKYRVAEAERAAGTWVPEAQRPPKLPDLAQVTGWSRADLLKAAHHEGRALFGGWRIDNLKRRREREG